MYRLLVADDEIIERKVLLKTLQKNLEGQCELFQAENGREALEIYEKEKIQIAILDIEMPGINGIQAAEKIREKDKNCCIIFLTAYDEFSYAKKAITVRALDYILKPWDEKEHGSRWKSYRKSLEYNTIGQRRGLPVPVTDGAVTIRNVRHFQ